MDLHDLLEFFVDAMFTDTATGGSSRDESRDQGTPSFLLDPSHVCRSCGEEYDVDPDMEIGTCRSCGGVKVERA